MSDNSHLTIGDLVSTWRYHVPTFVTFLFKDDDVFIEREAPLPPRNWMLARAAVGDDSAQKASEPLSDEAIDQAVGRLTHRHGGTAPPARLRH